MLAVAGAQAVDAVDAEAGLAMIDAESFEAVLMDLRMPGMDGLTAVRRVRGRGDAKADMPVIVVTAETGLHLRNDCLAAGAHDVLQKPITMTKLFQALGHAMARAPSRAIC